MFLERKISGLGKKNNWEVIGHFDEFPAQKANEIYQSPFARNLRLMNMIRMRFLSYPTV